MRWNERPRRALVLLKPEEEMLPLAAQTIDFLQRDMGLKVMVEAAAAKDVGQVCVFVCECSASLNAPGSPPPNPTTAHEPRTTTPMHDRRWGKRLLAIGA